MGVSWKKGGEGKDGKTEGTVVTFTGNPGKVRETKNEQG
jgi:hypothetical protein